MIIEKKIKKEEDPKILKDNKNNIICSRHRLFENSVCIEKDCKYYINCIDCALINNHFHKKNINISTVLNKNIHNQLYNEELYDQKKIIDLIEKEIENYRKSINKKIDRLEKKLIKMIKNYCKEEILIKNKKIFQESKKEFLKNNNNFKILKKLIEDFYDFSLIRNTKKYEFSESILKSLKNSLNSLKKETKNLIKNFAIKKEYE